MRKLVAVELVSLDGVIEKPEEWAFSYSDEEMQEANAVGMAASDAMLLGRVTHEGFASFWPNQPGGTPIVDYINGVRKYVVSRALEEPLGWNNSVVIEGDGFVDGVAELKRQPGKNITVVGSAALVRSLLRDGLLDELNLMIHPVVVGGGHRLFRDEDDRGRWRWSTRGRSPRASSPSPTAPRTKDRSGRDAPGSRERAQRRRKD